MKKGRWGYEPVANPRSIDDLMRDPAITNPLREYLRDRGETLVGLARRMGVNYHTLSVISLGYRPCPADLLMQISLDLGLEPERVPIRRWSAKEEA